MNTSIPETNFTTSCVDENDIYCPRANAQITYWTGSVIFCGLGLVMLAYTYKEYRINKAMHLPMVQVFYPMLLGDFLFTGMYFPYHLYNISKAIVTAAGGGSVENLVADSPFCYVSWLVVSIAVCFQMWGLTLISYAPYKIIKNSRSYTRNGSIVSRRGYIFVLTGAFLSGLTWFVIGVSLDHVGDYAGIYCAASSWANEQGAILFSIVVITFMFMTYFFTNAFLQLRGYNSHLPSSAGETALSKTSWAAAKTVLKFGLMMMSSLLFCYINFTLTAFFNASQLLRVPMAWEVVSGLTLKFKAIIDCVIILNLPVVRRHRKRRLAGQDTATFTDTTSANKLDRTGASYNMTSQMQLDEPESYASVSDMGSTRSNLLQGSTRSNMTSTRSNMSSTSKLNKIPLKEQSLL